LNNTISYHQNQLVYM